jgi:hypothetical protein
LAELLQWIIEEQGAEQNSWREIKRLHDVKRSVFLCAEGAPAFVRALGRHHTHLCEENSFNAIVVLMSMSKMNEAVLSSIVETNVCSVVVQCI